MKQGMTLQELATVVDGTKNTKKDYVSHTSKLSVGKVSGHIHVGDDAFTISPTAHNQLSQYVGIPKVYYDRMLNDGNYLWAENVNHWLKQSDEYRLVRTIDNRARAWLSDRYKMLDNYDVASTVLPILKDTGAKIESCNVSEDYMYLNAVFYEIQAEAKSGDILTAGIQIKNSEVGLSSLRIEPMVIRLVCMNGATVNEYGYKRYHVGAQREQMDKLLSQETLAKQSEVDMLKVRDILLALVSEEQFTKHFVPKVKRALDIDIDNPVEAIEILKDKHSIGEAEGSGILKYLIEGGDLNNYGLSNAVTRYSQDKEVTYDRAMELQRIGWQVLSGMYNN